MALCGTSTELCLFPSLVGSGSPKNRLAHCDLTSLRVCGVTMEEMLVLGARASEIAAEERSRKDELEERVRTEPSSALHPSCVRSSLL